MAPVVLTFEPPSRFALLPFRIGIGKSSSSPPVREPRGLNTITGAFDYDFGALDDLDNALTKSYTDIVYSTFGAPSNGQLLFMNLSRYLPGTVIRYIFETGSDPNLQKARENRVLAHRVARELIQQKRREMLVGQSEKDLLSLLGRFMSSFPLLLCDIKTIAWQSRRTVAKTSNQS